MLKKHAQVFEGLFTASDMLVVSIAWTLSYWVRFISELVPVDKGIPPFTDYLRMLIFVWLIWAFVFRRFGLYRAMRGMSRLREAWTVVKANFCSVVLLMAVTYLFREKSVEFSRAVFVIFLVLSSVFAVGSRSLIRVFLRVMRRHGYNLRYALVVGNGRLAKEMVNRISNHPEYGIDLIGCLTRDPDDPRPSSSPAPRLARAVNGGTVGVGNALRAVDPNSLSDAHAQSIQMASGLNVIGTYSQLPDLLEQGGIDQVLIALPLADHDRLDSIVRSIGDSMIDIRIVPDVHQFIQLGSLVEEFDGLPVISLASTPLSGINRLLKRTFDLVVGTLSFIMLLPLMLTIALVVKLTSRGPIFFAQERVGLDGQRFYIYKFRTMKIDAESKGACFAVKNDPRTTLPGRFLRKFNLDELPQLANVIRGQMSLVGPRPERPVFIQEFRQYIPRYMLRHKVQAGMTGWAQVNGWRGNTSIERRIEHDLFYIENWSIGLDLKILGLTVINSFRDGNAY